MIASNNANDSMDLVQLPQTGDRFQGRWRIESEVGKGGFSVVYRAVDDDGRVAAVKILLPDPDNQPDGLRYDGELADRFIREARLLQQLDSPYTIRMWEYGESDEGLLYMIFEFIDGRSLFDEIKNNGALAPSRVIHILRQTLIGLDSSHMMGILHRDIKPNNIMLFERDGDRDRVKLVDFGIAKMFGESEALPGNDLTAAGLLVGTPRYMSPEQLKGQQLAPPSDLYSVGLCAVEMLTGRKCIPGKDRFKIVEIQLRPEPVTLPPDLAINPGLRNIVHKLTQKPLQSRYGSAAEVLRDLEVLAGDPGATGDTVYETVPGSLAIPQTAPGPTDEETVLHRVNASELDQLIAQQGSGQPGPMDPTVSSSGLNPTVQLTARDEAPTRHPGAADRSYGSGEFDRPAPADRSYDSGQFNRPAPADQSYGSGQHPGPAPADRSYGSGEFDRAGRGPADQSFGSGQFNRPTPADRSHGSGQFNQPPLPQGSTSAEFHQRVPADESFGSNEIAPPPDLSPQPTGKSLTQEEKIALVAALILPGVGHLLLGQTGKGIGAIVLLLVTVGFAWPLLAPISAADAFLVIRARKRREVGKLEFFPDYEDLL